MSATTIGTARRLAGWGLAIALVAGITLAVYVMFRPPVARVTDVASRRIAPEVTGVGTIEAKNVVRVSAEVTGRIVAVFVDQGDRVAAGQPIVEIDGAERDADIARAEADLERARVNVESQTIAVERAKSRKIAVTATYARARAASALADADARRWTRLRGQGVVSAADAEARETAAIVSGEDVRVAEAERDVATHEISASEAGLRQARQEVAAAVAELAAARARRVDTRIASPFDGYVVSRDLEPGSLASPGATILQLADPRTIWATVHIDESRLELLAVGGTAEIRLKSHPGKTFAGRVARIRLESDRVTEQLAVDVAFDEIPDRLALGEQAEATIHSGPAREALAIPLAAVVRTDKGKGVLAVEDGRLRFVPARFGVEDGRGWIEVAEGLEEGVQVVVAPGRLAETAREGSRVTALAWDEEASEP